LLYLKEYINDARSHARHLTILYFVILLVFKITKFQDPSKLA